MPCPSSPQSFKLLLEILRMLGQEKEEIFFLGVHGAPHPLCDGGDNRGGSAHLCADVCWDNSGGGGSSIYQLL